MKIFFIYLDRIQSIILYVTFVVQYMDNTICMHIYCYVAIYLEFFMFHKEQVIKFLSSEDSAVNFLLFIGRGTDQIKITYS